MFIQLPDPLCLDTPGTTLVEFNDFPNMSTEHLEANHRRMIRILKHQCVALGVRVHVIARDHQHGTFDWRQRAKPGCLDPCQSRGGDRTTKSRSAKAAVL